MIDGKSIMKKIKEQNIETAVSRFICEDSLNILKEVLREKNYEKMIQIDQKISFYDLEIKFLESLPNEKIKRIFYSLLCYEKLHWHESGWIRFEIDELAELGRLKVLKCEDFADLVPFGLKMRVIGSKNAVSTYYSIGWTIEKQAGKQREKKVVDVLGIECAEKFWEVVNASDR